jgi:hypothetical protein
MGEVYVKLKIRGVDAHLQPAGSLVEVSALVDTGASRTIVNTRVAREAGVVLTDLPGNVSGIGGTVPVTLGVVVLAAHECGCAPQALLVGISDTITEAAGAEVVLGHDYMQNVRMRIAMEMEASDRRVTCGKVPHKPRTVPPRAKAPRKRAAARRRT